MTTPLSKTPVIVRAMNVFANLQLAKIQLLTSCRYEESEMVSNLATNLYP